MAIATKESPNNPMAATWTKAAIVRRAFKAGPRRKADLVYDAERGFLECRILYIELRDAMIAAGIKTGANDIAVGLVLAAPGDAEDRFVFVLPAGGSLDAFVERAQKVDRLQKRRDAFPIGVAFWQRDRESGEETWVRPWRLDSNSAMLMSEVKQALKEHKGNEFELEF